MLGRYPGYLHRLMNTAPPVAAEAPAVVVGESHDGQESM